MFKSVKPKVDFIELESNINNWWNEHNIVEKYLTKNDDSSKRFSFIDGPITANNRMGVHHAWGRTYKDLYQRFKTMQGYKQRYQNGFDGQGLWIEVEVEKELGFKSKRDIESFGIDKFVEMCKQRVIKFSDIQTEQSKQLAYWMDWNNSYHTMSDENNYTIWHFLKLCHEKGWLYEGTDVMPWCPRCGTGLSEHEIVTEGYQEIVHPGLFIRFPLYAADSDITNHQSDSAKERSLLIWTTTPWTLSSNIAAAVNPKLTYIEVLVSKNKESEDKEILYLAKGRLKECLKGDFEILNELKGSELVGHEYNAPFGELPVQKGIKHRVIAWNDVSEDEGTGIVHIAPGAGKEDFALSKTEGLSVIAPLDETGVFIDGFDWLTGKNVYEVNEAIFDSLKSKGVFYRMEKYKHRYPVCWRCNSELVFRLVNEWFISMKNLRHKIAAVTKNIRWIPAFGLQRELDWLKNMDDWMVSKKRYWGLALPIYKCECGNFDVIGSEQELKDRAVSGWFKFDGKTPHRPWIDFVKIECSSCGRHTSRIKDVGNPWLDAGIVPFSTLDYLNDRDKWQEWFPADWISESFPGQFRNWFYSLLTMSTVLENSPPATTVFSYALMRDEKGNEMHKSKGNSIEFVDAAERMGVDAMRWVFARHNPAQNLSFGYRYVEEVRRHFLLTLWNIYSFFVTYANIDNFQPTEDRSASSQSDMDLWILSELNQLISKMTENLESWQLPYAAEGVEQFVEDLSNWYVRRSRRRFWKTEGDKDKNAAYSTLYTCLTTLSRLLAPFAPFIAEMMYRNLVADRVDSSPDSVHLTSWPKSNKSLIDEDAMNRGRLAIRLASLGRSARAQSRLKVRQPLAEFVAEVRHDWEHFALVEIEQILKEELNVKTVRNAAEIGGLMGFDIKPNLRLLGPKYGKRIGEIRAALQLADATEIAKTCEANETISIGEFKLEPDEVIIERVALDDYAVATDAGYAGAVLTIISDELKTEGTAREIVRVIQNLRKSSGLEISDRINLWIMCSEEVTESLQVHSGYIAEETLAETLELGAMLSDDALGGSATEIINIDDDTKITVTLEKA